MYKTISEETFASVWSKTKTKTKTTYLKFIIFSWNQQTRMMVSQTLQGLQTLSRLTPICRFIVIPRPGIHSLHVHKGSKIKVSVLKSKHLKGRFSWECPFNPFDTLLYVMRQGHFLDELTSLGVTF